MSERETGGGRDSHLEASSTFRSSAAKSTTSGKRVSAWWARKCRRVVFWSA